MSATTTQAGNRKIANAYGSLAPDLRTEIDRITTKVETLKENDVRVRHEVGKELLAIMADTSGKYGPDPKTALQTVMPLSKDGLRPMISLAETFEVSEIDSLLALRHAVTNERLTWSHFIALTRLRDTNRRTEMATKAVESGWNSKDLVRAVTKANGGRKSKGGRKARKPTTLGAGLDDVVTKSTSWDHAADTAWLCPDGIEDMFNTVVGKPGYRADAAMVGQLTTAVDRLEAHATKVAIVIQKIKFLKHRAEAARTTRTAAA